MKSLYTKKTLNNGHLCITAKTAFPKGVRYKGVPLYMYTIVDFKVELDTEMSLLDPVPSLSHYIIYTGSWGGYFTAT